MTSRALDITLTEPQAAFLKLDCRYPLFTGGFGSGKSTTMIVSAFLDATHCPGAIVTIYEPTYQLVRDVAMAGMERFLIEHNIKYTLNKNEHSIKLDNPQFGRFEFRSYENPDMLIGYESYTSHIDEIDTLPLEKAKLVWDKILGRTRQWPKGLPADKMISVAKRNEPNNRVSAYSTPEGFNFTYRTWGQNVAKNEQYKYVKASTDSNPFAPASYIESLRATYSGPLVDAYLNGEWVNLQSGSVYSNFDRKVHSSEETIRPGEPLFIGCDFNVMNGSAVVFVRRNGGAEWHAVAELHGIYDTPEMIRIIQERWQHKGHHITMYPDCSGSARHTSNASTSDISLLRAAGFNVKAYAKNIAVKDRVQATQCAFANNQVFINLITCPTAANCLEQQAYDKNGDPDKKSGFDHMNDATSYLISRELPIRARLFAIPIRWAV